MIGRIRDAVDLEPDDAWLSALPTGRQKNKSNTMSAININCRNSGSMRTISAGALPAISKHTIYTERLKSLRNHKQRFTGFTVIDSFNANNLALEY